MKCLVRLLEVRATQRYQGSLIPKHLRRVRRGAGRTNNCEIRPISQCSSRVGPHSADLFTGSHHCTLHKVGKIKKRLKLQREFSRQDAKIRIVVAEGKHNLKRDIDKQVNDKERVLAALQNPPVLQVVEGLIAGDAHLH